MAGLSSCQKGADPDDKSEFYLVNNTNHTFHLYYYSESLGKDTVYKISPYSQKRVLNIIGVEEKKALKPFMDQRMIRLMDENNVDWYTRISNPGKWGKVRLPDGQRMRQLFFVLMNPLDDGMNRLQNLGLIRLFHISQVLTYLILLSSVIGLLYVRLRFKIMYLLLAVLLNFPVIYYTADFGYIITNTIDPFFIIPKWAVESSPYYVRFSIPVGAMIVWILLIRRKIIMKNKAQG